MAAGQKSKPKQKAIAPQKSFSREYGMAGCGLGSMVVGKKGNQVFAATTNGTAWNQTFGISFGTSNCIDSESEQVASRIDRFVVANKVALAGDIARGQGETLASLSSMLRCPDAARLGGTLQGQFVQIFPTYDVAPNMVTDSIITAIQMDEQLSGSCNLAI